jgi:hypothetical protein
MTTPILRRAFVALLATACLAAFSGCGYPAPIDPPVYRRPTVAQTSEEARLHARDLPGGGGVRYLVMPTGSMEPTITGGDYIVVSTKAPYEDLQPGEIITYRADWTRPDSPPVTHRLVQKDSHGWILSGDANSRSEASWRVTKETYIGKVVAIYRVDPKA